jgi:UDP-glucuronate decarboxylase
MSDPVVRDDLDRINATLPKGAFCDAHIVVTGCAGFLGFYFMQFFVRLAHELGVKKVTGLDVFLFKKPQWLTALADDFPEILELRRFDIARDDIGQIATIKHATHVVHMASVASPTFYRQFPIETLDANIWGLRRLLDLYKGSKMLRGFLFFSSSEIYGDPVPEAVPTDEEYRGHVACIGPRACYDESKRFGETLCYLFAKTHNMPVTVVRPFNNYGPGMRLDDQRLPADFASCVLGNRDIVILSDGSPTRTFCYVADAISGYLLSLLHGTFDYFNIGIEKPEIQVRELAEIFRGIGREICRYTGEIVYDKSSDLEYLTDNPNRRCPRIDKARRILGYTPQIYVEEGVRRYLTFLYHEMESQ